MRDSPFCPRSVIEEGELAVTEPAKPDPSFNVTVACWPAVLPAVVAATGGLLLLQPLRQTSVTIAAIQILRIFGILSRRRGSALRGEGC